MDDPIVATALQVVGDLRPVKSETNNTSITLETMYVAERQEQFDR